MKYPLKYIFLALFITAIHNSKALNLKTDSTKSKIKDKLYFGGSLGLQFGTIIFVDISPLVGYKVTEKLSFGLGLTYRYYKDSRYPSYLFTNPNVFGGRVFGKYNILQNLFIYSELEQLNMEVFKSQFYNNNSKERINIQSFFVGGGYSQRVGQNSFFNLMVLWNLNETIYTPYVNPVIRAGFNMGF